MVMNPRRQRDDGSVLVLTLILVVVLSVLVIALTGFVTVGLTTTKVATERTDTNADSSGVMNWAIEQFAKKQLRPDDHCGDAPNYVAIGVPGGLFTNGSTTTLQCAQTEPITGDPVVHLIATSVGEQSRIVESVVEVPEYYHGARISDWRVDIPIDVPIYNTTTTTTPTTTTTTTTTTTDVPNVPPNAAATTWTVNPGTTTTLYLNATDSDGTIASATVNGEPANLTATPVGGTSVELVVDGTLGTFSFSYTVTDDDGATSTAAQVTADVTSASTTTTSTTSTTTTTTTTLVPNPSCVFDITGESNKGKTGSGRLSVSNAGGSFTGWQVVIDWPASWNASWDLAVSATKSGSTMTVSGGQTVDKDATLNFNATLAWDNGSQKIPSPPASRPCIIISP